LVLGDPEGEEIFVLQSCVISSKNIQGIVYYHLHYLKLGITLQIIRLQFEWVVPYP